MLVKCLLFLIFLADINALRAMDYSDGSRSCPYPRFDHGRFRMRQRSKLAKFLCNPGYQLVGNKYATCRDGEWDVPLPTCVKPGCPRPVIENGVPIASHNGAWVIVFCFPGHRLVGSPTIYCDGKKWNASLPTCVDTTTPAYMSCDFEDSKLCGWTQDDVHDFDWKRLNKKTPSSFLFTGPSYDHTLGEGGNGYYMYIESTSRLENDTARLISPIYDASLASNGCFSFWYHMFGKTTGGLRVYQKPENVSLQTILVSPVDRAKYLLFEKWGNQGDVWFNGVSMLRNLSDSFQIVIEGVRGTSFTSDIAVDDVAILQGDNCTAAIHAATTPTVAMPDSCSGRCDLFADSETELGCGCTAGCVADGNCCPDFFDVCIFESTAPDDNSPADLPQTQKLVASTTTSTHPTVPISITFKSTSPPPPPTPTKITKTTTKTVITSPKTIPTASTMVITKKIPITTPTPKSTPKIILTTPKAITVTVIKKITSPKMKDLTTMKKDSPSMVDPDKPTDEPDDVTIVSAKWTRTTAVPFKRAEIDRSKFKKEQRIEAHRLSSGEYSQTQSSSGLKTTVVTITSLLLVAGLVYAVVWSRGARGRIALQRLRGRARHDVDVAYLHADVDYDDE